MRVTAARRPERGGVLATLLVLLVLAGIAAAAGYHWLRSNYESPGPGTALERIEVAPGTSLRSVLAHLESAGLLRNARAVAWYLRLQGEHPGCRAAPTRSRRAPPPSRSCSSSPRARWCSSR